MITIIVTVLVLVYKSFCNTVCIYGHANKGICCCTLDDRKLDDVEISVVIVAMRENIEEQKERKKGPDTSHKHFLPS